MDWISIGTNLIIPGITLIVTFVLGRKTGVEKKKIDFESIKIEFETELSALKSFRELVVSDNNSLKKELLETRASNKELRGLVASLEKKCQTLTNELERISSLICSNSKDCENKVKSN